MRCDLEYSRNEQLGVRITAVLRGFAQKGSGNGEQIENVFQRSYE